MKPARFLKALFLSLILCVSLSSVDIYAYNSSKFIRSVRLAGLSMVADFVLLSTADSPHDNFLIGFASHQTTATFTGTAIMSALSQVRPIQVMGAGFFGLSAWGHYLVWKRSSNP